MKYKGYTLLEVLLVIAIFAILIIPISYLIQQSIKINAKSQSSIKLSKAINNSYEELLFNLKNQNPSFTGIGEMSIKDENNSLVYRIVYNVYDYDSYTVYLDVYKTNYYQEILKKIQFSIYDSNNNLVKNLTYFFRVSKK